MNLQPWKSRQSRASTASCAQQTGQRYPIMIKPKHLDVKDKTTEQSRSGWIEPLTQVICYQYYEVNSHIFSECAIQLAGVQKVVKTIKRFLTNRKPSYPTMLSRSRVNIFLQNLTLRLPLSKAVLNHDPSRRTRRGA